MILYTPISALVKVRLFPTHIRMLGVSLPYAIGNTLFGGTAEYCALYLKSIQLESLFYWYISSIIALSTIAILFLPSERKISQAMELKS